MIQLNPLGLFIRLTNNFTDIVIDRSFFTYAFVRFPNKLSAAAAAAAFFAAIEAFLIKESRNCISMTKYVAIDVTVWKDKDKEHIN